jgi:hypothetical protein
MDSLRPTGNHGRIAGLKLSILSAPTGESMSNRAAKFLDRWETEHVKRVERSDQAEEARRLAFLCRADAAEAGISEQDLDAAADGDLIGNMAHALGAAAFRQLAAEQWADEDRKA